MQPKPLELLFDATHRGKYAFSDFLHGDISSNYTTATLKNRTIHKPDKKLKTYLAFLSAFIFQRLALNEQVVYSYRKGASPYQAVLAHSSNRVFFQADIENFFGSISRNLVQTTILSQLTSLPVSDIPIHLTRILDLTTIDASLPVGFPTSPVISNVCLTPFDNDLQRYCLSLGLIYTRYSDDIVISGHTREIFFQVSAILNDLLAHHFSGHLKLNIAKQKLTTIGRKVKILGMVILPNGLVTVDNNLKTRTEVLLHYYVCNRQKFLSLVGNDFDAGY